MAAQTPTVDDLVKRAISTELRQLRELAEFTFTYELTERHFTKEGKFSWQSTESGETYMSGKRNVNVRLVKDGKPLKSRDLDKQRKQAVARLTADAKQRGAGVETDEERLKRRGAGTTYGDCHMSGLDVLRYCTLSEPRSEGSRLSMDFDGCQSPWPGEAHYGQMHGTVRLDARTYAIDSWKAWMKSGPKPNELLFEIETQQVSGETRVPALIHLNVSTAIHLFPKYPVEWVLRWTNPRRFTVEVDQKIEAPAQ